MKNFKKTSVTIVIFAALILCGCGDESTPNGDGYDDSSSYVDPYSGEGGGSYDPTTYTGGGGGGGGGSTDTPTDDLEDLPLFTVSSKTYQFLARGNDGKNFEYDITPEMRSEGLTDANNVYYTTNDGVKRIDNTGSVSVRSDCISVEYSGYQSYFVKGTSIYVTYKKELPTGLKDSEDYEYTLYADEVESMSGTKVGKVGRGGLILFKSFDNGVSWSYDNVSYVNIGSNLVRYTPKGDEVIKGVLFKVITGFKLKTSKVVGQVKVWTSPFTYEMRDEYDDFYMTYVQESVFYLGSNNIAASFTSDSEDEQYHPSEENSGVSAEILNNMVSLGNGSVTFGNITYHNNGQTGLICRYEYNDGDTQYANDGDTFTARGKYHFRVSNQVGTMKEFFIYLLNKETLFSDFFGEGLLPNNKRIYDETFPYPVYQRGAKLNVNQDASLPPVSGNMYVYTGNNNLELYKAITSEALLEGITMDEDNIYCADLFVGGVESTGQVINFRFYFKIANRPDYRPSINYNLLSLSSRKLNLVSKAYAYNFKTTAGGSYVFLFPATIGGYQDASDFAFNMEKRYIEQYVDAEGKPYYYYHGVRYDSKVELTKKINENVKDAVYLSYINPNEEYGIEILSEENLQHIENTVLNKDVRVCVDLKTRDALMSKDRIINGFSFIQVGSFESESVTAIDEVGHEINVPYNIPIEEVLPKTGKYTIRETNWNGTREYPVSYIEENKNTSVVNFTVYSGAAGFDLSYDQDNHQEVLNAEKLVFKTSKDELDSQTIVTVTATGFRQTCLVSELGGMIYQITAKGNYKIEVTNRLGYSWHFNVEIVGA